MQGPGLIDRNYHRICLVPGMFPRLTLNSHTGNIRKNDGKGTVLCKMILLIASYYGFLTFKILIIELNNLFLPRTFIP